MSSSLTRLHKQMEDLNSFLKFAKKTAQAEFTKDAEVGKFIASSTWRQQCYAFLIVGIYGAHERFVREFVDESAGLLGDIYENYNDLPELFRQNHEKFSLELAKKNLERRESAVSIPQIVKNLHLCLEGAIKLNQGVFCLSTPNFRSETVLSIAKRLGVTLSNADNDQQLMEIVDVGLANLHSKISSVIDDLADRRNEIAHGSDYELLHIDILKSILIAVYSYDCWLCRTMTQCILKAAIERHGLEVGVVEKTFTKAGLNERTIGSIREIKSSIAIGEQLFLIKSNFEIFITSVLEIQENKAPVTAADEGRGPVGIDFGIPITEGTKAMKLPQNLDAIKEQILSTLRSFPKFNIS